MPLFDNPGANETKEALSKGVAREKVDIRYDDGCSRRVAAVVGEEDTPKGQKGSPRSTNQPDVTMRPTNPRAQQDHVVVGNIGAPLGVRFRCVILTFALYQFVDEDQQ